MGKVMFVCMGNICRSPTAHAVFRDLVTKQNLGDKIEIDSAGTHSYHIGEPPDNRAITLVNSKGIKMHDLRAQQITNSDFIYYDYIIAMGRNNLAVLQ